MIIHEVQAVLGVVPQPAQRRTPLPGIPGIAVTATGNDHPLLADLEALAKGSRNRLQGCNGRAGDGVALVAAIGHHIDTKEGAAVIDDRLIPFQLIEAFHGQLLRQALGGEQHVARDQALLDLGSRTTERGHVDRVDTVDRVADEGALPPTDHLLAGTHRARQIGEGVVVINECVEDLSA
ncbi:hypothetical protein D9M73_160700 [compost metagenome]